MPDFDQNTGVSSLKEELAGFLTARGSDARQKGLKAKQLLEQGLALTSL